MKSFRDYLKEDVVPTAVVKDGSIDLEREVVRAQINSSLASVLADPSVTPYNALMRASKVLSYFSIILPKRVYLDGEKGIEAIELRQFGDRMGMTDQGEFIKEVPGKFYLFIQYWRTHPNVVPYAATANFIASTGGMFKVAAKVVDKVELDRLIDMAEVSLSEGAEDRQALVKALAPKEDMHTALGDCDCTQGDSPSTKSAVSVMMRKKDKKLSSGELDEAMTRKQKDMAVRRFMSHDPKAGESILSMGKKDREEKKSFASAKKEVNRLKEEQIDELSHDTIKAYRDERKRDVKVTDISASHSEDMAKHHKLMGNEKKSKEFGDEAKWLRGKQKKMKAGIKLADKKMTGGTRVHAKEEYEKQEAGVKKRPGETHTLHRRNPGHKTEYHTITTDRDGRKSVKTGSPKYIKKHWDKLEEDNLDEAMGSVKKSYAMKKMKKKVSTQVKQGLGIGKERTNTVLVTNKGDPSAAGGGGVHRIPRDKYDPTKHNLASE